MVPPVGTRAKLMISDPWDFVTAVGAGPHRGTVAICKEGSIVIALDVSFEYGGQLCKYINVSARYADHELGTITSVTGVPVNGMCAAKMADSVKVPSSRGGFLGFIGTLYAA